MTFKNVSGRPGKKKTYIVEAKGGGAAFFDYDNDGDQDLYVMNGSRFEGFPKGQEPANALYENQGDGTFVDVSLKAGVADRSWGMGCTAADYDNDGDQDLYLTNFRCNVLYRNEGDGTFADVTDIAGVGDDRWSTGCAWGDYDNDGYLDLYVANYIEFDLHYKPKSMQYGQWKGMPVFYGPMGLKGAADVLYHNEGDGTFKDVTKSAGVVDSDKNYGFTVIFSDYDNDGDLDLHVANDSTPNFLYRNNGDGTFEDVSVLSGVSYNRDGRIQAGMGTDFGDYDNDGDLDIFVTNFAVDYNTLYRNDGDGLFSDISFPSGVGDPSWPFISWGTSFLDFDNDTDLDIFVANGHVYDVDGHDLGVTFAQKNQLLENKDGAFIEVTESAGSGFGIKKVSRGSCVGDYDNDGDLDIFILNLDDTPTLLLNDGGNKNNWLTFCTVGTKSNRDGIGARIRVTVGGISQIREVRSSSSFISRSDIRASFGLGKEEVAELVEIRWPSGTLQTFRDVQANRILVVNEDKGIIK